MRFLLLTRWAWREERKKSVIILPWEWISRRMWWSLILTGVTRGRWIWIWISRLGWQLRLTWMRTRQNESIIKRRLPRLIMLIIRVGRFRLTQKRESIVFTWFQVVSRTMTTIFWTSWRIVVSGRRVLLLLSGRIWMWSLGNGWKFQRFCLIRWRIRILRGIGERRLIMLLWFGEVLMRREQIKLPGCREGENWRWINLETSHICFVCRQTWIAIGVRSNSIISTHRWVWKRIPRNMMRTRILPGDMIRSAGNSLSWLIRRCTRPMRIGCQRMYRWWRIIWVICCHGTVVSPIVTGIGLPWMPMYGMMARISLEREVMISFYRYGRLRLIITWWSILKGSRIGLMICGWKCPMGIKGIC